MAKNGATSDHCHCPDRDGENDGGKEPPAPTSTLTRLLEKSVSLDVSDRRSRPGGNGAEKRCGVHLHGTTMTSTMLLVNVDRSEPIPLHDQVAAEIRRAIADGEAGPGERLPLVQDIAAVLGVNKNTVLRAMHILRDEGLLEFRRGRGITVVGAPEQSELIAQVRELLGTARHLGYRREDLIQMIKDLP
jgi:GntR family transcriptional regulator